MHLLAAFRTYYCGSFLHRLRQSACDEFWPIIYGLHKIAQLKAVSLLEACISKLTSRGAIGARSRCT